MHFTFPLHQSPFPLSSSPESDHNFSDFRFHFLRSLESLSLSLRYSQRIVGELVGHCSIVTFPIIFKLTLYGQSGHSEGDRVGKGVGPAVGANVGGELIGANRVGDGVGSTDGALVGFTVGSTVGPAMGTKPITHSVVRNTNPLSVKSAPRIVRI